MKKSTLLTFGWMGILASVMVGTGEFLMHFNSSTSSVDFPFGYFIGLSEERLTTGHFLSVLFIPFYFLGYWHIYNMLKPGNQFLAKLILLLSIFAFSIGGMWISSRANLGVTIQALQEVNQADLTQKIVDSYNLHIENLVQILRVVILLLSIIFVIAILKGGTLYPKWMIFFNPVFLLLIVFALYFYVHPIGKYLAPTAMNVAHFLLFSASLFALHKNKQIL